MYRSSLVLSKPELTARPRLDRTHGTPLTETEWGSVGLPDIEALLSPISSASMVSLSSKGQTETVANQRRNSHETAS